MLGDDKKRARRYPKPGLVWYHVLEPAGGGRPAEGVGSSLNVSRTGLGFVASEQLAPATLLFVHLRSRDVELTGLMRVARVHPLEEDRWEVGVRIEVMPPDHRALLERVFR